MLKSAQDFYTSLTSPLGFSHKKHQSRAVISALQKRAYIIVIWLVGCLRVEVQRILDRAVTDNEICICSKPSVFATLVSFPGCFACPLDASFPNLLVAYREANQAAEYNSGQTCH
jgi:hypothetical protein